MRLLFLGDVVGRAARNALVQRLPDLIAQHRLDFVVVNGENAAGGFGITEKICAELFAAGIDAITGGNHSWDQREALNLIEREPRQGDPRQLKAWEARVCAVRGASLTPAYFQSDGWDSILGEKLWRL
jgi:calcineurin-like phosphoesterase